MLKIYNNTALNPVGKCKIQLQDPETKQKLKVPFTIVDERLHAKSNLLGCRTAQQMKLIQRGCHKQINQVDRVDHT